MAAGGVAGRGMGVIGVVAVAQPGFHQRIASIVDWPAAAKQILEALMRVGRRGERKGGKEAHEDAGVKWCTGGVEGCRLK